MTDSLHGRLTAIHDLDLLHRDIKPGNIMSITNKAGAWAALCILYI